ncbi:hypothetical protein AAHA92_16595 [Salvia divinorum]|uniref:Uncharacterized protein n=1 Tax=Salvia divinorum TaxID=28513 RepID=A0ABD1GW19_SALDI
MVNLKPSKHKGPYRPGQKYTVVFIAPASPLAASEHSHRRIAGADSQPGILPWSTDSSRHNHATHLARILEN